MLNTTNAHVRVLDPTGRLPIPSSDATTVKPVAFGMGRATFAQLHKVESRVGQQPEQPLLLPRKLQFAREDHIGKQHSSDIDTATTKPGSCPAGSLAVPETPPFALEFAQR